MSLRSRNMVHWLSGIAALIEKCLLFWRYTSAKDGIAMGKASEAAHDVAAFELVESGGPR